MAWPSALSAHLQRPHRPHRWTRRSVQQASPPPHSAITAPPPGL
ncbi:hypothetical protein [Lysobacter gummosus]